MPARDLSAFFEDDALTYPGVTSAKHPDGKTYRVASPDAETGLRLAALGQAGLAAAAGGVPSEKVDLDDDQERSMYEMVLGATLVEMRADQVPWTTVQHMAQDAFLYWSVNEEFADAILASKGEAVARANRADRRAAAKTSRTSRSTGGSKSSPASTPTQARTRKQRDPTRGTGRSSTSPNARKAAKAS